MNDNYIAETKHEGLLMEDEELLDVSFKKKKKLFLGFFFLALIFLICVNLTDNRVREMW